jgi:transcriptional regulator with XRE-family HTH domain
MRQASSMPISGMQIRMARAALKIGIRDLAKAAEVSPTTVTRIEADLPSNPATLRALQRALEAAGVEFIPENGGGAGVRLKHRTSPPGEGEHSSRHGTDKES